MAFFTDSTHKHTKLQAQTYNGKLEGTPEHREQNWARLFSLSLVSKQLREETKLMPYTLNVFHAPPGHEFGVFLGELKVEYAEAIQTIMFGDRYYGPCDAEDMLHTLPRNLGKCTGLKTVVRLPSLNKVQLQLIDMLIQHMSLNAVDEEDGMMGYCDPWADCEMMEEGYEDYMEF